MATQLSRTASSTTDAQRKTWTLSFWLKPSNMSGSSAQEYHYVYQASGGSSGYFRMDSDQKLRYRDYTNGGSPDYLRITNRVFRDPSAWYHIVLRNDTTQSTAADRIRLYVNGELQEWQNANQPAQDHVGFINSTFPYQIGQSGSNGLDSTYLAQYIMCAGQSYAPTVFGSTNANGIWIPNSQPSVTYGTNGFKLDFTGTGASADASGFGADSSGNGNHFASSNLGTNPSTTDQCINNFATLNPLVVTAVNFSEGNCKAVGDGGNYDNVVSTIAFDITTTNGWYAEFKMGSNVNSDTVLGICKTDDSNLNKANASAPAAGTASTAVGMRGDGQKKINDSNSSYGSSYTTGDIMSIAVKGGAIYFYKNGTIQNSGTAAATGLSGTYYMVLSVNGSATMQANFGNPSYTITSGNADANGYGNFEYAVPSGYYALCTKNLGAYGG
jgi:hypothetical protein